MALTRAFVARMEETLMNANLGEHGRNFFRENPGELIALFAIALAYSSIGEYGDKIKIRDGSIIAHNQIGTLDAQSRKYFTEVCEMKRILQSLHAYNWQELMETLDALSTGSPTKTRLRQSDIANYNDLSTVAHELGSAFCNDPDFQEAWQSNPNLSDLTSAVKSARKA